MLFSRNFKSIQQYGKGIGTVLSWVVRQIGNTVVWLGRKAKAVTQTLLGSSENFCKPDALFGSVA